MDSTSSPAIGRESSSRYPSNVRGSRCGSRAGGRTAGRCAERRGGTACFRSSLPEPDALGELAAELADLRDEPDAPFDLVVEMDPGVDPSPWEGAGATWVLTSFDQSPVERDVRAAIEAGP